MGSRAKLLLCLLPLVPGALGCAADASSWRRVSARPVTEQLLGAGPAGRAGWITHGGDWNNQRYVPFDEINRRTVARLEPVWRHDPEMLFRRNTRNESTPIVVDDLLIYTDLNDLVVAVDTRDGRERWRYQPALGPVALCCGMVNRGVAVYGDKVYLATLDARVIALRRSNGSVVWNVSAARPGDGYSFTMAPLAAGGKIIVGASGGEFQIRGFVDAFDPETGRRLWRFWTTPSPEQGGWYGRWSDTTPEGERLPRDIAKEKRDSARYAEAWRKGGAPVWSTPAYDPALGLLIVGTGEPSAVDGVMPPGDNLFSTSLIAIDIATGTLRWYYQMVPHNLWNLDASSPPVLFDVTVGDSTIPAVGHAGKTGWVYILDRRTGRRIRRSDPLIPLENIFPVPSPQGVRASPAVRGGSSWPPPAYSPGTGLLYVPASHVPMLFVTDSAAWRRTGDRFAHAHFTKLPEKEQFGVLSAVDVSTGKIRWQRKVRGHLMYGGALATAGDLVFFSESGGWLDALDAATGETLWRERAVEGPAGPPISFLVQGRQRIAVTSKRGITVYGLREGGPAVAGTRGAGDVVSAAVASTGSGGVRSSSR
jgi:alcohol dehydrogenase (cytochrome c)